MRPSILVLSLLLVVSACGGSEPPSGSSGELEERPDEPGSTRASREAARERVTIAGEDDVAPSAPVAPPATDRPLVLAHAIDAEEGEDGRGQTIAATRPIAIDLDARRFPPRALDPVLSIGELRFSRYTHPRPGILRFVVADRALLPEGVEVSVQYGDDAASRVVVAGALEVRP